ncbi:hypothetical protein AB4Z09_13575 [Rhodococcus sp. TAF43]|uniref:hypothetical protein n=1 Tax=Rhodococcus sp. TAF43 TaxID=3237483 RepID=UPI003F978682
MGLAPTGIWADSPAEPFVGRQLPDGRYLIVEDRATEEVADTWDLAALSRGGGLWAVSEIDGPGYAYLSRWHDGEQQCEVLSDGGEWVQQGALPAEFDPEVQQLRDEEDDGEDVHAADLILSIAKELTDYVCGDVLDERHYELLAPVAQAAALQQFRLAVTEALSVRGFAPMEPNNSRASLWFAAATGLTGVQVALELTMDFNLPAGVRFGWAAQLLSQPVTELFRTLPRTAAPLDWSSLVMPIDELFTGLPRSIVIDDPDRIAEGVGQFVEFVDGPVADWLAERTTLTELVAAARQPQRRSYGMHISPRLLQSAAALCVLEYCDELASDLMAWFLADYEFRNDQDRDRAEEFDRALRDRFPSYDAARAEQRTDFAPFLAVLPRIANAHLGSWSRSDLDPLFEAVGWPIAISEGRLFREDLVARLNGYAVRASLHASRTEDYMDADRWGFGKYWRLTLRQSLSWRVMPEAYAAALRSCVELLGPPPVVGGPHAQAIWRGANVTYTLSTRGGGLNFSATPTEAVEGLEYWEWKWGDDWNPPESWRVTTGAEGVRFGTQDWWVPERRAETWSMLDDYITALFPSLAGDLALLAPYATRVVWGFRVAEDPGTFIRGWFSDESAGLDIHLPGAEPFVRAYPPAFESGRRIAAETTAALRKFGVESPTDLEMVALAPSGTQKLDTIRLGFTG